MDVELLHCHRHQLAIQSSQIIGVSKGFLSVQVLIYVAVTGVLLIFWSTKFISPGTSAWASCLPGFLCCTRKLVMSMTNVSVSLKPSAGSVLLTE